jgi:acetoin utilization protein AcuB
MRDVMTPSPHSIGHDQKLSLAHQIMRKHHIRHLPVLEAGKLVGVLSQRDLFLVETLRDVDPEEVEVSDAMSSEVFHVEPTADLADIAREMGEKKIGCAVVLDGDKVIGVFTTTDALRVLAEMLAPPRKEFAADTSKAKKAARPS